ncbi:MAG: HNH endonuclease [Candidatus Pacearchaeota archaeon]|nr:HNH endonuclease [Candidatus Pacearchaeota archaeon]
MVKSKPFTKTFNYNYKPYLLDEEGNQISRRVAYNYIYLKHKDKYPLNWKHDYVVHHVDGETFNNSVKNLYICTQAEHNLIHQEQKARLRKFFDTSEIDYFLKSRIPDDQGVLSSNYPDKTLGNNDTPREFKNYSEEELNDIIKENQTKNRQYVEYQYPETEKMRKEHNQTICEEKRKKIDNLKETRDYDKHIPLNELEYRQKRKRERMLEEIKKNKKFSLRCFFEEHKWKEYAKPEKDKNNEVTQMHYCERCGELVKVILEGK